MSRDNLLTILRGLDRINQSLEATSGEIELLRQQLVRESAELEYARKNPLEWMCHRVHHTTFGLHDVRRELRQAKSQIGIVDSVADHRPILRLVDRVRGELLSAVAEARLVSRKG